jgi:hypothetical protein
MAQVFSVIKEKPSEFLDSPHVHGWTIDPEAKDKNDPQAMLKLVITNSSTHQTTISLTNIKQDREELFTIHTAKGDWSLARHKASFEQSSDLKESPILAKGKIADQ